MPEITEGYILNTFEEALQNHYIQVYYQPVIRTISKQLCSFEALARWEDPVYGLIIPDQFIGVLERHRLIHRLDTGIIRQVCARIRQSLDQDEIAIPVSVNLSRLDFELCDIFSEVEACVNHYRIPHSFLYIEITESMLADNETRMPAVIEQFRNAGYQVWMDDFGSGYSSLNVLKDFSFDELKLDMHFINPFHQRARKIITSVIQMAKNIDIHTLMEGIETQEQFDFLRDIGCEKVQGYLFGRPMPYDQIMIHLRQKGIEVERPKERNYYDDLGKVNFLSAVPFMSARDQDNLVSARQLNSIPISIVEIRDELYRFLFYNTAFEHTVAATNWGELIFRENSGAADEYAPLSDIPVRILRMLEEAGANGNGKLYFISGGEYYEFQAKCIVRSKEAYSILLRLDNLSRNSEISRMNKLDDGLRQIYSIFDRVTLFDLKKNKVDPLFVGIRDEMSASIGTVRDAQISYADIWIFPEDREAFLNFMEPETIEERILESHLGYLTSYFRTFTQHGQFTWKQYILVRLRPQEIFSITRDAESEIRNLRELHPASFYEKDPSSGFSGDLLWKNFMKSSISRTYWKDTDRRYQGVSKGFLNYYGFSDDKPILGKTDEELGWYTHPDLSRNEELKVLQEGVSSLNTADKCIVQGIHQNIVSSVAPIYDEDGKITGLIGSFTDRDMTSGTEGDAAESSRLDLLTGLLNSRGLAEEGHVFRDEYFRRKVDFVRILVAIDDVAAINRQYGFDHGDKMIAALGKALQELFGTAAVLGRVSGYQFVILRQFTQKEELEEMLTSIRHITSTLTEVDGIPCTLYLSIGLSTFSESEDLVEQTQQAEIRLLADQNEHSPTASQVARSSEIFRLYDHLPIAFAVYKVQTDPETGSICGAKFFYVNHKFKQASGKKASELIGHTVQEIFPTLSDRWYSLVYRAAVLGEEIKEKMLFPYTGVHYLITASQIIRPGYCAFTYQETGE